MACFDRWCQRRGRTGPEVWRWGLVFVCALIHGLGIAEAPTNLGLQGAHKLRRLLGFNLGIEPVQLAAAGLHVHPAEPRTVRVSVRYRF